MCNVVVYLVSIPALLELLQSFKIYLINEFDVVKTSNVVILVRTTDKDIWLFKKIQVKCKIMLYVAEHRQAYIDK